MAHCVVYKSRTCEFLDDLFSGTRVMENLTYARGLLGADDDVEFSSITGRLQEDGKLARGSSSGTDPAFPSNWLEGWTRMAGPDVERLMRLGYQEAVDLASSYDPPRSIETLWVTGASESLEVHICEGRQSVNVVMLIPSERSYGSTNAEARSWAVRAGSIEDSVADRLDAGEPPMVKEQTSGRRRS